MAVEEYERILKCKMTGPVNRFVDSSSSGGCKGVAWGARAPTFGVPGRAAVLFFAQMWPEMAQI